MLHPLRVQLLLQSVNLVVQRHLVDLASILGIVEADAVHFCLLLQKILQVLDF